MSHGQIPIRSTVDELERKEEGRREKKDDGQNKDASLVRKYRPEGALTPLKFCMKIPGR